MRTIWIMMAVLCLSGCAQRGMLRERQKVTVGRSALFAMLTDHEGKRRYLGELMQGKDPIEGLEAFIERRQPSWQHA